MQELGHDQVGDSVVDRRAQEDDPLLEEPRVDVEGALAAVRLFDDRRDEVVAVVHSAAASAGSGCAAGVSGVGVMSSARSMVRPSSSAISTCSVSHASAFPFLIPEGT